jgi:anaerobic ribonucleoside-triphosphate reductase
MPSECCPKCGKQKIDVCPICGKPVDVYSRVVGYLRPVHCWNEGKQAEFSDRVEYTTWGNDKVTDLTDKANAE